jgi:hypothetical protein
MMTHAPTQGFEKMVRVLTDERRLTVCGRGQSSSCEI